MRSAVADPRITICNDDLPMHDYYGMFASSHVCLAPSRWEGLGLHLYEAIAFGMPIITNDNPPMNEMVEHDVNGVLVKSKRIGQAASGIDAFDPQVDDLARGIEAACDRTNLDRWSSGELHRREQLSWQMCMNDFERLTARAAPSPAGAAR